MDEIFVQEQHYYYYIIKVLLECEGEEALSIVVAGPGSELSCWIPPQGPVTHSVN